MVTFLRVGHAKFSKNLAKTSDKILPKILPRCYWNLYCITHPIYATEIVSKTNHVDLMSKSKAVLRSLSQVQLTLINKIFPNFFSKDWILLRNRGKHEKNKQKRLTTKQQSKMDKSNFKFQRTIEIYCKIGRHGSKLSVK